MVVWCQKVFVEGILYDVFFSAVQSFKLVTNYITNYFKYKRLKYIELLLQKNTALPCLSFSLSLSLLDKKKHFRYFYIYLLRVSVNLIVKVSYDDCTSHN